MRVGDRIRRKVPFYSTDNCTSYSMELVDCECIVEYIHPERRYFTIRVLLPSGRSFRTSEYFPRRAGI